MPDHGHKDTGDRQTGYFFKILHLELHLVIDLTGFSTAINVNDLGGIAKYGTMDLPGFYQGFRQQTSGS